MTQTLPNIFSDLPSEANSEHFLNLYKSDTVEIERIVSRTHASPKDFWYDQDHDEWVLILKGEAVLEFSDGEMLTIKTGDHLFIPKHKRHRVNQTSMETVWLAVLLK